MPGASVPHHSVSAQALLIEWGAGEKQRSYIVIESGDALRRPVIVATLSGINSDDPMSVVYAGAAYYDKDGFMHIDCRQARIYGPQRANWSPDSFMISPMGVLRCIDDAGRGSDGHILQWHAATTDQPSPFPLSAVQKKAAAASSQTYGAMRLQARVYLEGTL